VKCHVFNVHRDFRIIAYNARKQTVRNPLLTSVLSRKRIFHGRKGENTADLNSE